MTRQLTGPSTAVTVTAQDSATPIEQPDTASRPGAGGAGGLVVVGGFVVGVPGGEDDEVDDADGVGVGLLDGVALLVGVGDGEDGVGVGGGIAAVALLGVSVTAFTGGEQTTNSAARGPLRSSAPPA
ncbi:hypothetical protein ACSNOI_44975, partial [Actinomadura kijaniata]|uniref:hypothetical protein n=1 Tax=Actinomadura kijaniata TaxID=46161 RepID=UPI003F1ABDF4